MVLTCNWYSIIGNSSLLSVPLSPFGANCFLIAAYLTAIVTAQISWFELSCIIPTRPNARFSKDAPNIFPGSDKRLS